MVSDGVLCTGRLSSPLRDEDSDGRMATLLEPLDGQLNAFAGEHSTISVPEGGKKREGEGREELRKKGERGGKGGRRNECNM